MTEYFIDLYIDTTEDLKTVANKVYGLTVFDPFDEPSVGSYNGDIFLTYLVNAESDKDAVAQATKMSEATGYKIRKDMPPVIDPQDN